MNQEIIILYISAASIGFFHTLFGPDHYLPFIVMSKARKWSMPKTVWITFLCGIGHVGSSMILGGIGIVLGISITRLKPLENIRGNFAAWLLIAFGLVYLIWGLRKVFRNKTHEHRHYHQDGIMHSHKHTHTGEHTHIQTGEMVKNLTPWIIFVIFVLGPCEPMIPLLMYPAAKESLVGLVIVSIIFGSVTIGTMIGVVIISTFGLNFIPLGRLERYTHVIAGAVIFLSGLGIQFLGL